MTPSAGQGVRLGFAMAVNSEPGPSLLLSSPHLSFRIVRVFRGSSIAYFEPKMYLIGLGTATPPERYTQQECWEALRASVPFAQLQPRSKAILKKVLLGDNGIATRHLCLNPLSDAFQLHPDALHDRYAKHAPRLAAQAAQRALQSAGTAPEEVDAVLISTCTGYLCPGLTSYLTEQIRLRGDALGLDLVGQGCGAALPNLRTAEALLGSGRCECVLSVCVEICSAAFYLDDDAGVLVSACLFGDGAGAAVLSRKPQGTRRSVRWLEAGSTLIPEDRDRLRFEQKGGMLRNRLTLEVPELAGEQAEAVLVQTLHRARVDRRQIAAWILHAGGRDVLLALQNRMQLRDEELKWSAAILRRFGNVSSPSVLFVLEEALAAGAPDGFWWMSSFGAGFSCHGALLEVA